MQGAKDYAELFKTGRYGKKYGKLWIISSFHATGKIFRIFVIPENSEYLDANSVEVYGVISGYPGWSEIYGWIHKGPWVEDFEELVKIKREERKPIEKEKIKQAKNRKEKEAKRIKKLLDAY